MTYHPGIFAILGAAAEAVTASGYAFLGGGASTGATDVPDMDRWDSALDSWTARTDVPSPTRESRYNMTYDGSTYQYLFGGNEADTDQFNDSSNSWAGKGRCNGSFNAQSGYGNSTVWHQGGPSTTDNEGYTVSDNKWTDQTSMTSARDQAASCSINDDVYSFYGRLGGTNSQSCESYDTSADSWATETSGPTPTRTMCSAAYIGDYAYITGGLSSSGDNDEYYRTGDSWSSKTSMTSTRQAHGMANCGTDHCVALAGFWNGFYYGNTQLYNKSGDSWSSETAITPVRGFLWAAEG